MKKKLLAVLVASFLMVGLLAACAPQAPEPAPTPPAAETPAAEAPAAEDISIGLAMPVRDEWLALLEAAVVNRANELGVSITVQDAEDDVNTQISHVQTFAVQGKDAIIIGIIDAAFTEALVEAADGIPVVFVNRLPDEAFLQQGAVHYVGSQEVDAGRFQAQFFAEYFAGRDSLDYVLLMGPLDHAGAIGRSAGFREGMADAGFEMNNVFEHVAAWDRAIAMDALQTFIGTGINFDLVVANNDEMAIGAFEALRASDMMDIPVGGVDAGPEGVRSILAGELAVSVFQDANGQGTGALNVAHALVTGQSADLYHWLPFVIVTAENAHEFE